MEGAKRPPGNLWKQHFQRQVNPALMRLEALRFFARRTVAAFWIGGCGLRSGAVLEDPSVSEVADLSE